MYLERLGSILEIVGHKGETTVADICSHAGVPKASAYRIVHDLVDAGFLDGVGGGRYTIGTRLKRITEADQSDHALLETISPVLRRAAETHGAAFFLSRVRGRAVEIVHVETPDNGVSFLHPGLGKRPIHACSCSKAVAAFSPDVAETVRGRLKAYTESTVTDRDVLESEFDRIRRRGYAECVEEIEVGICSVAAPLGPNGQPPTLSIGATGSVRVFTSTFRRQMGSELIRIARELADRLGWHDAEPAEVSA